MNYTKLFTIIMLHVLGSTYVIGQSKALPAEMIVKEALADATNTHKNVFIIFHASWCGWCHKMDNAMNDEKLKPFFDNNYVVVHLIVDESKDKKELENPGAGELRKKYHGGQQGLPYWFILDAKGNFLADSRLKPDHAAVTIKAANVGCPASNEEVNYFVKVIKKTSSLNKEQLTLIQERFLKNKE
jgi:thiol-disulfide isomerase/thioredoxin